jgi:hypothetical protein
MPSTYFHVVLPYLYEPVAGILYQSQLASLVESPRSSEQSARVVEGYRVARIDANNGTGTGAHQYASYALVRID